MGRAVYTRRAALGILGVGALSIAASEAAGGRAAYPVRPPAKTGANALVDENSLAGTPGWEVGAGGTRVTHRPTVPRAALDEFGLEFSPALYAGIRQTLVALRATVEGSSA